MKTLPSFLFEVLPIVKIMTEMAIPTQTPRRELRIAPKASFEMLFVKIAMPQQLIVIIVENIIRCIDLVLFIVCHLLSMQQLLM